jgi:hypothetical protein
LLLQSVGFPALRPTHIPGYSARGTSANPVRPVLHAELESGAGSQNHFLDSFQQSRESASLLAPIAGAPRFVPEMGQLFSSIPSVKE